MRKVLLVMFSFAFALGISNCANESSPTQELTIKQRVAAAKLVPLLEAEAEFQSGKRNAIWIEIPGTGGSLIFDVVPSHSDSELMDEVYLRFKKEFDANNTHLKDKFPDGSKVKNIYCGDWQPIGEDPNGRVYRYCCNVETGVCIRRTCDCGYCCEA